MNLPGLIILEGADAAGKTTLAKKIVELNPNAHYMNLTRKKGSAVWDYQLGVLMFALKKLRQGHLVVVDRHWISEASEFPVAARVFDRIIRRFGGVYVMCVPRDQKAQLERQATYKDKEAVAFYSDLMEGNLAHPGYDYASQLIRFGDFAKRPDVMKYDMMQNINYGNPGHFAKRVSITSRLACDLGWSAAQDPTNLNLLGYLPEATTVFVGDAISPSVKKKVAFPLSDSTYFNKCLHEIGVDESKLVFTNADPRGDYDFLTEMDDRYPDLHYVALGEEAGDRLAELHLEFEELRHPQYIGRFSHDERADYLLKLQRTMS